MTWVSGVFDIIGALILPGIQVTDGREFGPSGQCSPPSESPYVGYQAFARPSGDAVIRDALNGSTFWGCEGPCQIFSAFWENDGFAAAIQIETANSSLFFPISYDIYSYFTHWAHNPLQCICRDFLFPPGDISMMCRFSIPQSGRVGYHLGLLLKTLLVFKIICVNLSLSYWNETPPEGLSAPHVPLFIHKRTRSEFWQLYTISHSSHSLYCATYVTCSYISLTLICFFPLKI